MVGGEHLQAGLLDVGVGDGGEGEASAGGVIGEVGVLDVQLVDLD